MNDQFAYFILLVIAIGLVIRFISSSLDRVRIRRYVSKLDGELLSANWDPFGPGWFGEKSDRIYRIRYRDRDDCIHTAHVKTSLMSGVYLTNDEIISRPPPQPAPPRPKHLDLPEKRETVEEEKARLRKRLAELEQME